MIHRAKILLLIPHLGGGGAEHVTALLAENLSAEKYELHLGLITQGYVDTAAFPASVQVHRLGASRIRTSAPRLIQLIWQLRPEVTLSGMAHLNFLVLLLRPFFPSCTRVLVRQNGTVSSMLASRELPIWTRLLYLILYPRADRVICQSEAMALDMIDEIGIPPRKLAVLPNPVNIDAIRAGIESGRHQCAGPGPHLLAVGRLSAEKGFDLLLEALAIVRLRFPTADLTIAGQGRERLILRTQCRSLHIEKAVRFAGHVDNSAALFPDTTLFVASSRHEGMPNALLEAAAAGLPLATLPSSRGIVDLLTEKPGAFLAREISAQALADSIVHALGSLRPGERFQHGWIDQFRLDHAIDLYEGLIDATLAMELA
jgi:glycosyltransferase involved in cell wall biosynthesis